MIEDTFSKAELIYNNNSFSTYQELVLLCQYLYWEKGFKDDRILSHVKKAKSQFLEMKLEKMVQSAMKTVRMKKLFNNKSFIGISEKELETIKKVKNRKHQRLLLTMLVNAKGTQDIYVNFDFDKYGICFHGSIKDACALAKIRMSKKEMENFVFECRDYISAFPFSIYLWKINFIDDTIATIKIEPQSSVLCANCGKPMKKESDRQEYCKECSTGIAKEKTRARVNKYRNKCNGLHT